MCRDPAGGGPPWCGTGHCSACSSTAARSHRAGHNTRGNDAWATIAASSASGTARNCDPTRGPPGGCPRLTRRGSPHTRYPINFYKRNLYQ